MQGPALDRNSSRGGGGCRPAGPLSGVNPPHPRAAGAPVGTLGLGMLNRPTRLGGGHAPWLVLPAAYLGWAIACSEAALASTHA
jgi:hypothetical protein